MVVAMSNANRTDLDFAARLRGARAALDLTQDKVASEAGISRTCYSALERGRRVPHRLTREALARVLGAALIAMPDANRAAKSQGEPT